MKFSTGGDSIDAKKCQGNNRRTRGSWGTYNSRPRHLDRWALSVSCSTWVCKAWSTSCQASRSTSSPQTQRQNWWIGRDSKLSASASSAPSCIIHAPDDRPCTIENGSQASTQCRSTHWVHTVHFKKSERREEKVDRHKAVKVSDRNANLNLQDESHVTIKYAAYRHKVVEMLGQFQNMWDIHLGSIKAVQKRTELKKSKDCPRHSAPNSAIANQKKSREARNRENSHHRRYVARQDRMDVNNRVRAN